MKPDVCARLLFGASAILLGVIALMWHDAETWQSMSRLWKLPAGAAIGAALMVALILGGLGLAHPRTVRLAAFVLCIVFAAFALACVGGIVAAPSVYATYGSCFEQLSMLSGAVAAYAGTEPAGGRARALALLARLGLGLSAVSFTLSQIIYLQLTAELVPAWIPPGQMAWAVLTTIAFALAAVAILLNRQARLAIRLMALMTALFSVLVWIPRVVAAPGDHGNWSELAFSFLITGAAWVAAERGQT